MGEEGGGRIRICGCLRRERGKKRKGEKKGGREGLKRRGKKYKKKKKEKITEGVIYPSRIWFEKLMEK